MGFDYLFGNVTGCCALPFVQPTPAKSFAFTAKLSWNDASALMAPLNVATMPNTEIPRKKLCKVIRKVTVFQAH